VRKVLWLQEEVEEERRLLASFISGLPETATRQEAIKQIESLLNTGSLQRLNAIRTLYLVNILDR
jgi:hypothetical protein